MRPGFQNALSIGYEEVWCSDRRTRYPATLTVTGMTLTLARVGGRARSHIRRRERTENVANKGFFCRPLSAARQVSGWLADFLRTAKWVRRRFSGRLLSLRVPSFSEQRLEL